MVQINFVPGTLSIHKMQNFPFSILILETPKPTPPDNNLHATFFPFAVISDIYRNDTKIS